MIRSKCDLFFINPLINFITNQLLLKVIIRWVIHKLGNKYNIKKSEIMFDSSSQKEKQQSSQTQPNQKHSNYIQTLEKMIKEIKSYFTSFSSVSDALNFLYKQCSLSDKNFIKKDDLKLIISQMQLQCSSNEITESLIKLIMKRQRMSKYQIQASFMELFKNVNAEQKKTQTKELKKKEIGIQSLKNVKIKTEGKQLVKEKEVNLFKPENNLFSLTMKTQKHDNKIKIINKDQSIDTKKRVQSLKQGNKSYSNLKKDVCIKKQQTQKKQVHFASLSELDFKSEVVRVLYQHDQKIMSKGIDKLIIEVSEEETSLALASKYCFRKDNYILEGQKPYIKKLQHLLREKLVFKDQSYPPPLETSHIYQPVEKILKNPYVVISQVPASSQSYQKIKANHVKQGHIGNCYFMSAVASLADAYPNKISELLLFESNPSNYLPVRLFVDGQWKIIEVDNYFPCLNKRFYYSRPLNNQIWVMLIEKAFAKVNGGYKALVSGLAEQSLLLLTGAPSEMVRKFGNNEAKYIKSIQQLLKKGYIISISISYLRQQQEQELRQKGIVCHHSYSLLDIIQIQKNTYVKIKNPWGNQKIWTGKWDEVYNKMPNQEKQKYNYQHEQKNGVSYMEWRKFYDYFYYVQVCKYDPTYYHTSLKLNFNSRKSNYLKLIISKKGTYNIFICQQQRRRHILTDPKYKQPHSRLIIMKKNQDGSLALVASRAEMNHSICNAQVDLQKGEYIISAKIKWKKWEDHKACIVAYSRGKVEFELIEDRKIAPPFRHYFIEGLINKNRQKQFVQVYSLGSKTATRYWYLDSQKGAGYMRYLNDSFREQQVSLTFQLKKMKLIKPWTQQMNVRVKAKSQYKIGFFVDFGFNFNCEIKIT